MLESWYIFWPVLRTVASSKKARLPGAMFRDFYRLKLHLPLNMFTGSGSGFLYFFLATMSPRLPASAPHNTDWNPLSTKMFSCISWPFLLFITYLLVWKKTIIISCLIDKSRCHWMLKLNSTFFAIFVVVVVNSKLLIKWKWALYTTLKNL